MTGMPVRRLLLTGLAALPASRASAQGVRPSRPIVLTVPFAAGGSADLLARPLAEKMTPLLDPGARVGVEKRAGAGGAIGSEHVRRPPADGRAVLLGTPSTHGTLPAIVRRLSAAADAGLSASDLRERLAAAGIDAVTDSTPESTGDFVAAELAKFRGIVTRARLTPPR